MAVDKFDNGANGQKPAPKHMRKNALPSIDDGQGSASGQKVEQGASPNPAASKPRPHLRKDAIPRIDVEPERTAEPQPRLRQVPDPAVSKPRSHLRKDAIPRIDASPEQTAKLEPVQSRKALEKAPDPIASKPRSHLRKDAVPVADEEPVATVQEPVSPKPQRDKLSGPGDSARRSHLRKDAVLVDDAESVTAELDATRKQKSPRDARSRQDDAATSSHLHASDAATAGGERPAVAKRPELVQEQLSAKDDAATVSRSTSDVRSGSGLRAKSEGGSTGIAKDKPKVSSQAEPKTSPRAKIEADHKAKPESAHKVEAEAKAAQQAEVEAEAKAARKVETEASRQAEPEAAREVAEAEPKAASQAESKTSHQTKTKVGRRKTAAENESKVARKAEAGVGRQAEPEAAREAEAVEAKPAQQVEPKTGFQAKSETSRADESESAREVAKVEPKAAPQAESKTGLRAKFKAARQTEPEAAREVEPKVAREVEPAPYSGVDLEDEYEINDSITVSRPTSQPHPVRVMRESDPSTPEPKPADRAAGKKLQDLRAAVPKRFKQVSLSNTQSAGRDTDESEQERSSSSFRRIKLAPSLRAKTESDESEDISAKDLQASPAAKTVATAEDQKLQQQDFARVLDGAGSKAKAAGKVAGKKLQELRVAVPKRLKQASVSHEDSDARTESKATPRRQSTARDEAETAQRRSASTPAPKRTKPKPTPRKQPAARVADELEQEPKRPAASTSKRTKQKAAARKQPTSRSEAETGQERSASASKRAKAKAAPRKQSVSRSDAELVQKRPVKRSKPTGSKSSKSTQANARPRRDERQRPARDGAPRRKVVDAKRRKPVKRLSPAAQQRRKRTIKTLVIAVVALVAVLYLIDGLSSFGKIHRGVNVGGIDVSNMTVDEAAQVISTGLAAPIEEGDVIIYASDEARESTDEPYEISFDYEALEQMAQEPPESNVFSVSPATLNAHIDGQALAQQAYDVGRGGDFLLGRIAANTFGVTVTPTVAVDDVSVDALADILTRSLGTPMVNPDIAFEDGAFITTQGNDGYMVQPDEFRSRLSAAILSDDKTMVVPMNDVRMQVDDQAASDAAQAAQAAVSQPVTLRFESASWDMDSQLLGQMVSTYVKNGNQLVPYVSLDKVEQVIPTLEGLSNIGTPAQDVKFSYDGYDLSYTEASNGMMPDYESITSQLNAVVFGDEKLSEEAGEHSDEVAGQQDQQDQQAQEQQLQADIQNRQVVLRLAVSYPTRTYADAHAMGLDSHLIAAYTTDFTLASDNKIINIKLMSDLLTNTVIAPGETFSINGTAGEANEEKGFTEAGSIVGGQASSEIGGGICQVATTIYNAAFEAGYPIVERHNHSTFVSSYPDGMDAAISWPYLDLKFQNDTDNYIMLLMDYNSAGVTCSLWGISPGYTTEHETVTWYVGEEHSTRTEVDNDMAPGTEYQKAYGSDGHVIAIQRDTYEADGTLRRSDVFTSVYNAKDAIIVRGPSA